ncbi:hypothetical protein Tco_0822669 [Tanacetum coccineum]|uniref:Uncharacterized protein n=1 Tax=Tanacetum coccineum TaxID=301880 RepID=A0ABQ5AFR9_9ASTR
MARFCDFKPLMMSGFFSLDNQSLAIYGRANLSPPSKMQYSSIEEGGKSLSSTSGGSSIEDLSFLVFTNFEVLFVNFRKIISLSGKGLYQCGYLCEMLQEEECPPPGRK